MKFQKIIETNKKFLLERKNYKNNLSYLKEITSLLNKNKMIILSGIKFIGKTDLISDFIKKTNMINYFFYFNKEIDLENQIKNSENLIELTNSFLENNKSIKIIILQNVSKVEGIKDYISYLYKKNIKIIIIGNNIKIPTIPEIELKNSIGKDIEKSIIYGDLGKTTFLNDMIFKKEYINLIKNDIINKEIFNLKSVKNIFLYNFTITFLSKINNYCSIRELHRDIVTKEDLTLKTFIDYIDFSIQAKIISKIYKYDLKNQKTISSKAKYYFTDNGIRNSSYNYNLKNDILRENLIFIKLNSYNFNIYGGLNGTFDFSFIGEKDNKKIYIHISEETDKNEIKKEINKLIKIGDNFPKYLIVNNLEEFGFKKFKYESVEIISFENFIKKELDF